MALNPVATGDAIANFVQSVAPAPGTPVSDGQLKALWEGIMTIIYDDLAANAKVAPGTFTAPSGGGPVTGQGGPVT
jgi:hypothetical protein